MEGCQPRDRRHVSFQRHRAANPAHNPASNSIMKNKTTIINNSPALSRRLGWALPVLVAMAISIPLSAQTSKNDASDAPRPGLITFDAPGAGSGPNQGTFSYAVSAPGDTAGFIRDMGNARRGFLRN